MAEFVDGEHLFAFILRNHCASPSSYAQEAVLAAVDAIEEYRLGDEQMADAVELAMIRALNATIPIEHADDFRRLANVSSAKELS